MITAKEARARTDLALGPDNKTIKMMVGEVDEYIESASQFGESYCNPRLSYIRQGMDYAHLVVISNILKTRGFNVEIVNQLMDGKVCLGLRVSW